MYYNILRCRSVQVPAFHEANVFDIVVIIFLNGPSPTSFSIFCVFNS